MFGNQEQCFKMTSVCGEINARRPQLVPGVYLHVGEELVNLSPKQHVSLSLHPPPLRRVTPPRLYAQVVVFLVSLQKDSILILRFLLQRNVLLNESLTLVLRPDVCIFKCKEEETV